MDAPDTIAGIPLILFAPVVVSTAGFSLLFLVRAKAVSALSASALFIVAYGASIAIIFSYMGKHVSGDGAFAAILVPAECAIISAPIVIAFFVALVFMRRKLSRVAA